MNRLCCVVVLACLMAGCTSKGTADIQKRAANNCISATVLATSNLDCGYPVLSFTNDSAAVRAVSGNESLVYVVKALPNNLNIVGKQLCVVIEPIKPEEDFACRAMGPSYPHLKIISATASE